MTSTVTVEDDVVEVALAGRLDADAMGALARALRERVATGRPFGVVLDRHLLSAPTAAGREALARWGVEDLPAVVGPCAAWADVFDERRAASLARAAAARAEHPGETGQDGRPGYPQQTFTDAAAARAWVARLLADRTSAP